MPSADSSVDWTGVIAMGRSGSNSPTCPPTEPERRRMERTEDSSRSISDGLEADEGAVGRTGDDWRFDDEGEEEGAGLVGGMSIESDDVGVDMLGR
jgi:hypothetical protein